MKTYIVRTSRGDVPVNPMGKDLPDKDLLVMARRILQAARSRGMSGRIVEVKNRRNPSEQDMLRTSEFIKELALQPIRAVPEVVSLLKAVASIEAEPVKTQRAISQVDISRVAGEQVNVVIVARSDSNDPALMGQPALMIPAPGPDKIVVELADPKDTAAVLYNVFKTSPRARVGVVTDVMPREFDPASRRAPAWIERLSETLMRTAALYRAVESKDPAGRAEYRATQIEERAREAERKARKGEGPAMEPEPLRFIIPGEGEVPEGRVPDILRDDMEEAGKFVQRLKDYSEDQSEEIIKAVADYLEDLGYTLIVEPYTANTFQHGTATPSNEVFFGIFYDQPAQLRNAAPMKDPIAGQLLKTRPLQNVISYPFDRQLGEPRLEGVDTIRLIKSFKKDPRWLRDVRDHLVPEVLRWRGVTGGAAGIRVRRTAAGADWTAPMAGQIEEFRLQGYATPKVLISAQVGLTSMHPYTAHIDALQGLANARKVLQFFERDEEYRRLTQQIADEKDRLTRLGRSAGSAQQVLESVSQYVDGITAHIQILETERARLEDENRRAIRLNDAAHMNQLRAAIGKLAAEIQEKRDALNRLPRNLGSNAAIGERLRALKSMFPLTTPEGEYRGDTRSGIYKVEVFIVPAGMTPAVQVGQRVNEGDVVLKGREAEASFGVEDEYPGSALGPDKKDKKRRTPAFAVVTAVRQDVPTTTMTTFRSFRSGEIPIAAPSGYEFAYTTLRRQLSSPSVLREVEADPILKHVGLAMMARLPKSGQGTPEFAKQVDALLLSAANNYQYLKRATKLVDDVNAFIGPIYEPFMEKLGQVYGVMASHGGQKGVEETGDYTALMESFLGKDYLQTLTREIDAAAARGELLDVAERILASDDQKNFDRTGTMPVRSAEETAELLKRKQRNEIRRRMQPELTIEPILYYTITLFDQAGKVMWEASVPHMKVEPPPGMEMLTSTGKKVYLKPIVSMFPLSAYRVSGTLRRSGFGKFGPAQESENRFMAMNLHADWDYMPVEGFKSKDQKELESRAGMLGRALSLAAESQLLAGQIQDVRVGEFKVGYSEGGSFQGSARAFQFGGTGFGGTLTKGRQGIEVVGIVPASEQTGVGYTITQTGIPKNRQEVLINRISRRWQKGYEDSEYRRPNDPPALDRDKLVYKYLTPYLKAERKDASNIVHEARDADPQALAQEAARLKQGVFKETYSAMDALSGLKGNPMRNLMNNPRYRQLVERTGRAFGRPVRLNAGEGGEGGEGAIDLSLFGTALSGAPRGLRQAAPAAEPEPAVTPPPATKRKTTAARKPQTEAERVAAGGYQAQVDAEQEEIRRREAEARAEQARRTAGPPPPPRDPVVVLGQLTQAVADKRRETETAFANFYSLLHNVRAADRDVEDARAEYVSRMRALQQARNVYFEVLGGVLGLSAVTEKKQAEQAADVARASAPTLRVPGAENQEFRSEMRSALARAMARQITADGLPLYDVNKELARREMPPFDYNVEEAARESIRERFGRRPGPGEKLGAEARLGLTAPPSGAVPTLIRLTPGEMERAAAAQGALKRPRPPSGASAFAAAERERTGRQLGAGDYNIPDGVLDLYTPGRKNIVLWMSPQGDHIIRIAQKARTAQFHQGGDVGLDGVFRRETWADVMAKALHHQVLYLTEAAMLGKDETWDIWVGKSGSPFVYRIYSGKQKKPFTVQQGFERLSAFNLDTDPQNDPIESLRAVDPALAADVRNWTAARKLPGYTLADSDAELSEDAEAYQNALARVFMKESIGAGAGLSLLREAARKKMREETRESSRVEMSEDVPTPFVIIPPDVYDSSGLVSGGAGSDAGQRLMLLLKGALDAARTGGGRVRIFDPALLQKNTKMLDETVKLGVNPLTLRATLTPIGGVKSGSFPSPLLAAAELANEDADSDVRIEVFVPTGMSGEYKSRLAERLGGEGQSNVGPHVDVDFIEIGGPGMKALPAALNGRFNRVLILNQPDEPVKAQSAGMFGYSEPASKLSIAVNTALVGNLGYLAGIGIDTDDSLRVGLYRKLFDKVLDKKIANLFGQGDSVGHDVPIKNARAALLDGMGLNSAEIALPQNPTRALIVAAVMQYMVKRLGLSDWANFIAPAPSMRSNPRMRPMARKNYDRRTKIDMASRYMRQQPWMFPTRE